MNIYDYIESPHKAVKKGYKPCYLTKVSAVVSRALSAKEWRKYLPAISLDDSVKDFSVSVFLAFLMTAIVISMPLTCWIIALYMPGDSNG
jgi:multisubunit Na+/H+ antiporter MnhC subunit